MEITKRYLKIVVPFTILVIIVLWTLNQDNKTKIKPKEKPTLRVFTYSSFQGHYGPGPELVKNFEKSCNCNVELVNSGEAGLIINRILMNPSEVVDLVIGVDILGLGASKKIKWKPLNIKANWAEGFVRETIRWNQNLIPYDWAPLTFVFRRSVSKKSPREIEDFFSSEFSKKVIVQDPRTSSPGLHFLFWMSQRYKDKGDLKSVLQKLKNKSLHSVAPSWSSAYGLFQKKKVDYVFSYFSSPVYHWIQDKDLDYQALSMSGDHTYQVEFLGRPEKCQECDLAQSFSEYMLSPEGQKIIMNKNVMFPVIKGVKEGSEFDKVQLPSLISFENYLNWDSKEYIRVWKDALN